MRLAGSVTDQEVPDPAAGSSSVLSRTTIGALFSPQATLSIFSRLPGRGGVGDTFGVVSDGDAAGLGGAWPIEGVTASITSAASPSPIVAANTRVSMEALPPCHRH